MIEINKIKSPFIYYCQKVIPLAFDESLSYYEVLCHLTAKIKEVINEQNIEGQAIEELQEKYLLLVDYVENYFKNLDVQEEINNKLDEMADSGELTDIIAQYLQLAGVLAYDTIDDLENATNVVNGSICVVLGEDEYNDGKTAFYKIRNITIDDTIDGYNIVGISETLIGERLPNYRLNQIENQLTPLNRLVDKKYIIIGDSYAEGYTPDGNVTSWSTTLKNLLGLDNTNCIITYYGGCGFTPENNTYTNLLNNLTSDNNVTDIIVCGGYNDKSATKEQITAGSLAFKNLAHTKFPNATIHLGFIGFTNSNERYSLYTTRTNYTYVASIHGYHYLNNVEYSLRNTYNFFSSDNIHPNVNGQNKIAEMIFQALKTGSADVCFEYLSIAPEVLSTFDGIGQGFINAFGSTCCNNVVNLALQSYGLITSTNGVNITANGSTKYEVATITKGYITGTNYNTVNVNINCVVRDDSSGSAKYYAMSGVLHFENKKISISLFDCTDTNNNFRTMSQVKQIQVQPFSASFDTMWC